MSVLRQPAVGAYLRAARAEAGFTMARAAQTIGLPEWSLRSVEDGDIPISTLDAAILLCAYGKDSAVLAAFRESEAPQAKPPRSALGRLIRARREALGLSPEALARDLGETPDRVRSWEAGRRLPPSYQLALLVRVLGLDAAAALEAILNPNPLESP